MVIVVGVFDVDADIVVVVDDVLGVVPMIDVNDVVHVVVMYCCCCECCCD